MERFEYDDTLLSSCANSELATFVAETSIDDIIEPQGTTTSGDHHASNIGSDEACSLLHQQHALHYGHPGPEPFIKMIGTTTNSQQDSRQQQQQRQPAIYKLNARLERFVQTVLLVHNHNNNNKSNGRQHHLHRLTLNRFADQDMFSVAATAEEDDYLKQRGRLESLSPWDFMAWESIEKEWILSPFKEGEEEKELNIVANLTIGKGGMGHLHYTRKKEKRQPTTVGDAIADKLKFPSSDSEPYFAVPLLDDPKLDGELLKVKPRKSVAKQVESGEFEQTDEFGRHLDWATENNPDGVPIVKDPFDQGECGSCWAFVAAGSLEASVARRQAHEAYNEYLEKASSRRRQEKHIDALRKEAVQFAQSVEDAAFQMANLSIQELIDCDTAADQGCIGGNPLLAFYFIHRYGLTSWSDYPYVGYEDTCQKKWVSRPVAKVKSWGIIAPNHEHHMEMVIRFIGPIAVGVNGADRSFLAYQDGIFDHPACRQGANHALLITGYGQEYTYTGELVRYWIARNSWGTDWGEDGYIRVKRGDGLKGSRGVCGIARSPSVALGGVMLTNRHKLAPYREPQYSQPDFMPLRSSPPKGLCGRFGFESCGRMFETFGDHKAVVLGLTGIICALFLAVWPLTFQCRQRRQRRRRRLRQIRESLRLEAARHPNMESPPLAPLTATQQPAEIDPLLGDRNITRYGE